MKIGILTHYDVNNQGAQLQMYSLSEYLKEKGHDVYILTYQKNFDFIPEEGQKNVVSLRNIPYFVKAYLFSKGIGLTLHNAKKYKCLKNFRVANYKFINYHTDILDAVIIGSDEVFSIDVGINSMMYGHRLRCNNVIAYAPAFGRTTEDILKEEGCYNIVKSGLENMTHLSARDAHTKKMIMDMTGRDVPMVCDPVILQDFSKLPTGKRKIKQPYLLVYSYDAHMKTEDEYSEIIKFAKKHKLITVSAGTYHKWCDKNIACDIMEWVDYFRYADYIVTDTFHGYVTSLKTKRPTALFVRSKINAFKLQSLMEETGTKDREIKTITVDELERVFASDMDYEAINRNIENMAQGGLNYLSKVLEAGK